MFDSWDELFDGTSHSHVPIYSFSRRDILKDPQWADRMLWHGSAKTGQRSSAVCNEWRSSRPSDFGMASEIKAMNPLSHGARQIPCNRRLVVLCVEVQSKHSIERRSGRHWAHHNRLWIHGEWSIEKRVLKASDLICRSSKCHENQTHLFIVNLNWQNLTILQL